MVLLGSALEDSGTNSVAVELLSGGFGCYVETLSGLLKTDCARDSRQDMRMKKKDTTESERKLLASVDKEMQQPRLAESVREAGEDPVPPTSEKRAAHAA
jgi:hypothetical protein